MQGNVTNSHLTIQIKKKKNISYNIIVQDILILV